MSAEVRSKVWLCQFGLLDREAAASKRLCRRHQGLHQREIQEAAVGHGQVLHHQEHPERDRRQLQTAGWVRGSRVLTPETSISVSVPVPLYLFFYLGSDTNAFLQRTSDLVAVNHNAAASLKWTL